MKNVVMEPALKATKIFTEYFEQGELLEETDSPKRKHLAEYRDGFLVDARRLLKGEEDVLRLGVVLQLFKSKSSGIGAFVQNGGFGTFAGNSGSDSCGDLGILIIKSDGLNQFEQVYFAVVEIDILAAASA